MSANLRRALHTDLEQDSFRCNMGRYLLSFDQLVAEDWASFKELQGFTTGHNLNIMFADRTEDTAAISAALPDEPTTVIGYREQLAHFMNVTKKSGYYAVPARNQPDPDFATTYVCFQILGFKPGYRKYMQRLSQWSIDEWKTCLSCAVLGCLNIPKDTTVISDNDVTLIPPGTEFKTQTTLVQPIPLEDIFWHDNIDYLHEFKSATHRTLFDEDSIIDLLSDSVSDTALDDAFVILGEFNSTQSNAVRPV